MTLATEREPRAEAVILSGLEAHKYREVWPGRFRAFSTSFVRDDSGAIIGGLSGHTSLGLYFLDLFYLPKALRERGLGGRIMEHAKDREGLPAG